MSGRSSRSLLLHPLILTAVGLFLLNDHLLKEGYPHWITGKLSDLAAMVFFPVFLAELWSLRRPDKPCTRKHLGYACIATGAVFACTNSFPLAQMTYEYGLGVLQWPWHAGRALVSGGLIPDIRPVTMWRDPTDLLVLPALLVPLLLQEVSGSATSPGCTVAA